MKLVIGLALSFAIALATPARAQHAHPAQGGDNVGTAGVSFQTSCAPALRQDFNRAVALLHSFWFAQAIDGFNSVLAKDPSCAMAHWGIASPLGNPFEAWLSQQITLDSRLSTNQDDGSPTPR